MEETGIKIKNLRFATVTNDIFEKLGKHYISICMVADYESGEVKFIEPEKCEKWNWFEWSKEAFPKPLSIVQQNLLKQNFNPFKY